MTKRQMIDEIMELNQSAQPEFLAMFDDEELDEYLSHLQWLTSPVQMTGDTSQYDKYFPQERQIVQQQPLVTLWNTMEQDSAAEQQAAVAGLF
ncbi:MAG TPA: hypothetical protein PKK48_08440 [Phycisphaerae bacterium]|nr:hypothetical protein [Phycisphaerae bacterium]HPS52661.1 hypothetical protein [Phycisphaerae bacterium]